MTPGRAEQVIRQLRGMSNTPRPQDEIDTLMIAIRIIESQDREIASLKREVRDAASGAATEARWQERQGDEYGAY